MLQMLLSLAPGNTRTLTVSATQAAGALNTSLTWDNGGGPQVLNYTVVIPPAATVTFTSAAPASSCNCNPMCNNHTYLC